MKRALIKSLWLFPLVLAGCVAVKTHSTIDPIHMTLDVNLKVQLEKELNDVFADIDSVSETIVGSDSSQ